MPNPQPVSANELANCSTRPAAIAKLNSYLRDMQQTRLHDSQQVQAMDRQLARIEIAKQQIAYLIGVHEELMKVPIYGHLFVWDWFDLNTDVRDSLAELESAVQSDRKTYLDRSNNLVQRTIILQGNIDLLQQCLGGTWEGDGNPVSLVRHEEPRLRVPEDSDCLITTIRNGVHMRIAAGSDRVVTEASVWLHFDQTDQPPGCSNLGVPQPISANLAFGGRILPHDSEATITGNTVHAIMYYPHPPSKPPEESARVQREYLGG